jgi:hypothetical protein
VARVVFAVLLACAAPRPVTAQASLAVLDVPYISQSESLCGGAAAAMVLRYWGARGLTAESFSHLVDRSAAGIRTDVLVDDVASRGWLVRAVSGTLALLDAALAERRPALALIEDRPGRYHYVVIVAATPSAIVFHDPARTPFRTQSRDDFARRWAAAGRWMAIVTPAADTAADAAAPRADVPAPSGARPPSSAAAATGAAPSAAGGALLPASRAACEQAVASGVASAQAGDLAAAERTLTAALSCPGSAVLRELAGVRVQQQRWPDARDAAAAAVAADGRDVFAWKVLATARFLEDDRRGALAAWNEAGEPQLDLVRVQGLTRTRARPVERLIGVAPGERLTLASFDRARRRVAELPSALSTALAYQPVPGGLAELQATVADRALLPASPLALGAIGVGAAVRREVAVSSGSLAGGGDRLTGAWRFWPGRPRVAFDYQAPAPWGGVWGVAGAYEEQPFDRDDVMTLRRSSARLTLADWATSHARWSLRAGLDDWRDVGRFAQTGGGVRLTSGADRVVGSVDVDAWSGDRRFAVAQARVRLRSAVAPDGWVFTSLLGGGGASGAAPADLWFAGDTGVVRTVPLRAHPVVRDGRLRTDQLGRSIVHASVEAQRWWRMPLISIGAAAFVDTARVDHRLAATPGFRHDVDVGGGFRATVPGVGAVVRVDLARGLRDGTTRLSATFEP